MLRSSFALACYGCDNAIVGAGKSLEPFLAWSCQIRGAITGLKDWERRARRANKVKVSTT
jgi:hypothetical protein